MSWDYHSMCPSKLHFPTHTTYYSSFFLLRVPLTINGQPAEIGCSADNELTLNCRYVSSRIAVGEFTFSSISAQLEDLMKKYGVFEVSHIYCEEVPLFEITFCSEFGLRRFLQSKGSVENELATLISTNLMLSGQQGVGPSITTTVQAEVFLINPDVVRKDAQVLPVTLENYASCLAIWKESEVFDFGSLFRTYRIVRSKIPDQGAVTLKSLVSELHEVVDWFHLGVHLDVPDSELMKIKRSYWEVDDCKTQVLIFWMKQSLQLTWSAVVRALVGIRMYSLAQKIAIKYGVTMPPVDDWKALQQISILGTKVPSSGQAQLLASIQQRGQKVEAEGQKLLKTSEFLEQTRMEKVASQNKYLHIRGRVVIAHTKTKVALRERKELRKQLQLKEQELCFLKQLEKQKSENEELKQVITSKEAEVKQLQEQLDALEEKLKSATYELHSLREELKQMTTDLEVKSTEVRRLEEGKAEVGTTLQWERRRLDMQLMLLTSAANTREDYIMELKRQLSSTREDSESKSKEIEVLKQAKTEKEEEVRKLSEQLHATELQLQASEQTTQEDSVTCEKDLELKDQIQTLMMETLELRTKLVEAEDAKQEAERQLGVALRQMEQLHQVLEELDHRMNHLDLQQCTAAGAGLELAETLEEARFEVHLVDGEGGPYVCKQEVTAELRSLVDGAVTRASGVQNDITPATYTVSYQPTIRGRHELSVKVNGTQLPGSTFDVFVIQPPSLLGQPVRTIEGLKDVHRIAVSNCGELVVTQSEYLGETGRLSLLNKDGHIIKDVDSIQTDTSEYKLNPCGVAVDNKGNIYVTDGTTQGLMKFGSNLQLAKSCSGHGDKPGQFAFPDGIALSQDEMLFVCDWGNHRIQIFTTDLKFVSCFGSYGSGEGKFKYPCDLSFDGAGNLYIVDEYKLCVQVFSGSGTFLRSFWKDGSRSHGLLSSRSIHVDHDHVYVTEGKGGQVLVFHTSGIFIGSFGQLLLWPVSITTNQDGFVFVNDDAYDGNGRLYIF